MIQSHNLVHKAKQGPVQQLQVKTVAFRPVVKTLACPLPIWVHICVLTILIILSLHRDRALAP